MTRHALGIDAGGTRTRCVVVDERGNLLGSADGPGANPNSTRNIEGAFATALAAATAQVHPQVMRLEQLTRGHLVDHDRALVALLGR